MLPGLGDDLETIIRLIGKQGGDLVRSFKCIPFRPHSMSSKLGDPFYLLTVETQAGPAEYVIKCSRHPLSDREVRVMSQMQKVIVPMVIDTMSLRPHDKSVRSIVVTKRAQGQSLDRIIQGDVPSRECFDGLWKDVPLGDLLHSMYDQVHDVWFWQSFPRPFEAEILGENQESVTFLTYQDLRRKLAASNDKAGFAQAYARLRKDVFQDAPVSLIHGDLHQGNVFFGGSPSVVGPGVSVIDWDTAQLGLPYEDFFYFAVVTDLEKTKAYDEHRAYALRLQAQALAVCGGNREHRSRVIAEHEFRMGSDLGLIISANESVSDEQFVLTEFETYVRLAMRYVEMMDNGLFAKECQESVRDVCKYLLERAKERLGVFGEKHGFRFADHFSLWMQDNEEYRVIDARRFNPQVSVAYAHARQLSHS